MSWGPADQMDRTAKILIDAGIVPDPDEARRYLESLTLQVAVGPEIATDTAAQAALATIVNAARRAFKGGVNVQLTSDPVLATGWTAGMSATTTVTKFGGKLITGLTDDHPTLVIGTVDSPVGKPVLYLTWNGWASGVVRQPDDCLATDGVPVAGVLAAGLGIAEAFQRAVGGVYAGRRDVGLSLWRPDLDWRSSDAAGQPLQYLPKSLWLLGLGHLGQAYAWTLGMLPYTDPGECQVALMDFDTVEEGNRSTQLLTQAADVGNRKARVVAAALESLGLRTRVVERAFDERFRAEAHAAPNRDEPLVALAGFDSVIPRRLLGQAGFRHVVDAGLGSNPYEYLDIVLHTFPAATGPPDAFPDPPHPERRWALGYQAEIARQVEAGVEESVARCGMVDIAGVTVGAAFVGTVASALVIADLLRVLHDGENYSVVSVDLREPNRIRAAKNSSPGDYLPAWTPARRANPPAF